MVNGPNLLVGTYPGMTLAAGEGYYMRTTATNIFRATSAVTLPPFSCYLPSDEKRTYFKLEESPDGINEIKNDELRMKNEDGVVYNLAGQRLQKMQKGVNIVNGNKVLIK